MFDIGWAELLVIGAVALVIIGPKDLPRVLYEVGRWVGKARGMMRELQSGFESMAREAELEEVRKQLAKSTDINTILDIEPKPVSSEPAPEAPAAPEGDAVAVPSSKPAAPVERLW